METKKVFEIPTIITFEHDELVLETVFTGRADSKPL